MTGTESRTMAGEPLVLAVAMAYPSLLTWIYFIALSHYPPGVQQAAYVAGKLVQFALPAVWVFVLAGNRWRLPLHADRSVAACTAFGLLVVLAMLGLYFGLLAHHPLMERAGRAAAEKLAGFQIRHWATYLALGVFYSLCHSLLEEYYWRWFVCGRLATHSGSLTAVVTSSLAFMAHHVILLGVYFGYGNPWTYVLGLCVAVGGLVWGAFYLRSGSLLGPWISHLLVDAGIFLVGYHLAGARG